MPSSPNAISLSRALGWFSIGLGIAEFVGARDMARTIGARDSRPLIRAFGLREVGTGLAILGAPGSPVGLWARVAGDLLDLAALGDAATDRWNPRRGNAWVGFAAVAGVTLVDIAAAMMLQERDRRATQTARRTRIDPLERPRAQARPPAATAAPREMQQSTIAGA